MKNTGSATLYQWNSFLDAFFQGCELWTSEDGSLVSVAIARRPDWETVIQYELSGIWERERFDATKFKSVFAKHEMAGSEFYDARGSKGRGKVWNITDEETPFPVYVYDLEKPQ